MHTWLKTTLVSILFAGLIADCTPAPASDAGSCGSGPGCGAGQVCGYGPGCGSLPSCQPDTGGDSIAIGYCGCSGGEFASSQVFPTQPYVHLGTCVPDDGGNDAAGEDVVSGDAASAD